MVITEHYLERLNFVANESVPFRLRAIKTLYGRGETIESKNRALRDIYYLLRGNWLTNPEPEWRFTKISELPSHRDGESPPDEVDEENWSKLLDGIEEAKQQTPENFDDLQKNFAPPNDVQGYMDWFLKYLPYLVLDLSPSNQGWTQARERLDWFLAQVPKEQGCPLEILEDKALRYMAEWNTNHEPPSA